LQHSLPTEAVYGVTDPDVTGCRDSRSAMTGVVGLADLGDQPGADAVQLSDRRVDRVDRVIGAAPGVRVGLVPGLPDRQPGAEIIDAAAEGRRAASQAPAVTVSATAGSNCRERQAVQPQLTR